MNFLTAVAAAKRAEIDRRVRTAPVEGLKEKELYRQPRRSLEAALRAQEFGVIAEIKKISPSQGVLRSEFDPVRIAGQYQEGGASAISVLTDEEFFGGRLEYLSDVRVSIGLPVLRKDFIVDGYQLHEARSAGADAVLLIVALLDRHRLAGLLAEAADLELEALVEVHDEQEIRVAVELDARLIGVNNRDLATLRTCVETSLRLGSGLPSDRVVISESGITSGRQLVALKEAGYGGALIGGFLMRQEDPGAALRKLLDEFAGRVS